MEDKIEDFDAYGGKGRRKGGFWSDGQSLGGDGGTPVCPYFSPCVSWFSNLGASGIQPTSVFFERVGAHGRVVQPCPTSFTSPTPVGFNSVE
ncbi:hypothetical protein GOBAR_AA20060 [Gossypium barbadense]|uniref:Uncharacterized protein n=1 Tax=Gossypium barbadense TaxID=3634 RepID=A0A2P5XB92_GOSBA|nr:hypothetical protein GOBAR_AA20060 [Gossypium barbadense]